MSFGFSVGDFITAIQLANKIRKEFVNAPSQFSAISDEVRSLSIVLQDADVTVPGREINDDQRKDLEDIDNNCRNIFDELQRIIDTNSELGSEILSVGRRIKRVWKRLKWDTEQIQELRSRISTNIGLLSALNGRLTRDSLIKLVQFQEDQGRQAVLDWLTSIDYASQQHDFISRRQAGTGQWLLESKEFQVWLNADQQTMFCPGIPGAGKTILTAVVINELTTLFSNDSTVGIAYIYFNFRQEYEQKIEDLLANLLKQLIERQPSLPSSVKDLYDRHKTTRTRLSLDEISIALHSVLDMYSRVFFVVDALDECKALDGSRREFLSQIFSFQAKYRANFLATSRFIPEITQEFDQAVKLEISASSGDVRSYLEGHMYRLPGFVVRSLELQEEIKSKIVQSVQGMFLLAQLHLYSLVGKRSVKIVRNALTNLPTGSMAYDKAYNDAMDRINGQFKDQQELAIQVLSWITCARRPLTTLELQHALGVEVDSHELDEDNLPEIEDMVSVCAGLVTIDEQSNVIRLVHYTTQEYFERTQSLWFPDVETNITTTCITYLSFNVFERGFCQTDLGFEERLRSNPFFDYAARYWGYHTRKTSILSRSLTQILKHLLGSKVRVGALSQGLLAQRHYLSHSVFSQGVPRRMTGLHLTAFFGIEAATKMLLDTVEVNVNSKDSRGRTPLSWAAENGHAATVQLFFDTSKVYVDCKDNYDQTPLSWAARNGHKATVQLFLETHEVEVDYKDSDGRTPLSWAAGNGHEATVQLFFSADKVDVDCKDDCSQTPLSWAARDGHKATVQLFLDTHKVEVDCKDKYGRTPLSWAAGNGHEAVVQLLLDISNVNVNSKDIAGWTPLFWAVGSEYEVTVQLLLYNRKVDVHCKDKYGQTPLFLAAQDGNEAIVKLLLDTNKVDVNYKDANGRTPLSLASENGHKAVVQLFLDNNKININYKDDNGRTPLLWAAEKGYEAIVQLFLDTNKVNVDSKDNDGRTPLSWAAENGHEAVVHLLLNTDKVDIDCKDNRGRSPLSWTAERGSEAIVQLLLKHGADPESRCSIERTPLWWAARTGNGTFKLLLTVYRVDVDSKDFYNSTPLSIAARKGHREVLTLLLTRTQCLSAKDNFGRTALWWSIRTGYSEITHLLLEKCQETGVDIQIGKLPSTIKTANSAQICDVCELYISDVETYYSCSVCNYGDFDICMDCFTLKAHCLDESHTLILSDGEIGLSQPGN